MELLDKIAERTQASILANISNSTSIQFTSETAWSKIMKTVNNSLIQNNGNSDQQPDKK
jgi:hypothetical protein